MLIDSKKKIEITQRSKVEGDNVDLKAVDSIHSGNSTQIYGTSSVILGAEN